MPILKLESASLAYGHIPLLDKVDLQIDAGERVCLVGRNGAGKSTLMRVLKNQAELDDGGIWKKPDLRLAYLDQEVPVLNDLPVYDVVASGLEDVGELLKDYHHVLKEFETDQSDKVAEKLSQLQHAIEAKDGWNLDQKVNKVLSRLELDAEALMNDLSGGYRRRVMLARALVTEPELLLLDEPTNHLDIEAIQWIEDFLLSYNGALLFITHDRAFLRKLATRIIELDRGQLSSWPGDYDHYLVKKAEREKNEEQQNAAFDKKLAQEETWIRQGIKARRTRNEGRVRALKKLREVRSQRVEKTGNVKMQLSTGDASGKIVIEAKEVSKSFAGKEIIKTFSTTIMRGDRVGILGPNGSGKSTLLKMLLGELKPDTGSVETGTRLKIAYFDQQREQLEADKSVADNLNHGSEQVTINGKSKHVMSYLQDFLFPPARVRSPVSSLSGGERNRLLLARLFLKPANLLVMDEPTNDLDVETLELLEELLASYDGTLLLVSHDRAFIDNVVTSTVVFEGEAQVNEYVGGYEDWIRQSQQDKTKLVIASKQAKASVKPSGAVEDSQKTGGKITTRKLSYKDQRELDALPDRIEQLEEQQSTMLEEMNEPDFYSGDQQTVQAKLAELKTIEEELETAYSRWDELS